MKSALNLFKDLRFPKVKLWTFSAENEMLLYERQEGRYPPPTEHFDARNPPKKFPYRVQIVKQKSSLTG